METVPRESETIAHKRARRISEKLKAARERINLKNAWWTSETVEIIGLGILAALNFILVMPLVGTPAVSTQFSGPIVPLLARIISLSGTPFLYSIQLVNVLFFISLPVSFYALVKFVSGRKFAAFLSALILSLPLFIFAKARVEFGLLSHESAFIASLTILPVAVTTLLKFLRNGGSGNLIIGSLIAALIALISPFGMFIFLITAMVTTFSEVLLGEGRIKILRLITVFIFAASLSSFWYNPALFFWMVTGPLGAEIRSMLGKIIPISFFVVPVLASLGYLIFDRKPNLQPFFLALFYSLVFLIIVVSGAGFVPSNPGRYTPMLGFSLAFLIGIATLISYEHFHFTSISKRLPIKGTKDGMLIVVSLALITFTITSRSKVLPAEGNVLGVFTDVKKGDIWVARDRINPANSIPGYIISFGAAGTLAYLARKRQNI